MVKNFLGISPTAQKIAQNYHMVQYEIKRVSTYQRELSGEQEESEKNGEIYWLHSDDLITEFVSNCKN